MKIKSIYSFGTEDRSTEGRAIGAIINDRLCIPILKELFFLQNEGFVSNQIIMEKLQLKINLEPADLLAHGKEIEFEYRIKWALNHLKNALFIEKDNDKSLSWKITNEGIAFVTSNELEVKSEFSDVEYQRIFKDLKGSYNYNNKINKVKFLNLVSLLKNKFNKEGNKFKFIENKIGNHYAWIGDEKNIIGNDVAHYEIGTRFNNKNVIKVDLHFEGKKKGRSLFYSEIGEILHQKINWFTWGESKSIEFEDDFDIEDEGLVDQLYAALLILENSIGNTVRNILKDNMLIENTNKEVINIKFPINQILYGPPGTGKTYNTVLESAKIITGNETISYEDALEVFNTNLGNQIEFITFHQNYSYEDFIQGLRPDTENGSALTFEKKDGVFKRIADRAYLNLKASENNQIAKQTFKDVFNHFVKSFVEGDVDEIEVKMIKTSYFITDISEKSISFRKNSGGTSHTLSLNTLEKMYNEENTGEIQGLSSYYEPLLRLLLEKGKANQNSKITKQNYVIIIDEINRANISRVFGELITLIEEDKRSHGKIPLRVTLPSGDSFIVPSNLYIIGTMNTADKSIALLDIALRRRFDFVPMYPNTKIEEINSPTVLETINNEIINRKGHDFTIGHAYFMGDGFILEKTINSKVIPLLLEYFMNDKKEVATILRAANIELEGWPLKMKTT